MSDGLEQAAAYMRKALELLDEHEAPADIGATLDLAICRLQEFLQRGAS